MENFYRIKTQYLDEMSDGALKRVKTEELVYASSYTEAETVALSLIEEHQRAQHGPLEYEISKTKIDLLFYSDTMEREDGLISGLISSYIETDTLTKGLYAVHMEYTEEVDGKEKVRKEKFYIPAINAEGAIELAYSFGNLRYEGYSFVVKDCKFDPAVAVLLPPDLYQEKVTQYEKVATV